MRVCLEGELDGELLLVADPSQFKYTTWSDKAVVTFEQNCKLQSATLDFCSHKFISVLFQVKFWCDFGLEVHLTAYISQHFLRFHWLKTPVKGMHENQVVANIQNAPDPEQAPEIWSLLGTLQPIA